jgi:hypothetical protein
MATLGLNMKQSTAVLCAPPLTFDKASILCLFLLLYSHFASTVMAHDESVIFALTGKDFSQSKFLREHGLKMDGWLSMGGTYLTHNPDDHSNAPITFNDRSGEFQLNQLNLYLEKPVDMEAKHWNFGGRVDLMFGTDSRFTQATGLDNRWVDEKDLRFYDLALPQAYLEVLAPFGNGITAKIGHFYTILGKEVVTSPNNFFYSHAYTMQYGEPFTHTGALLSYALNENFTLNAGAVAGWDNFDENLSNWNFLGGISWTNDEATNTVSWSMVSGDTDDVLSTNRTVSSLVVSHNFTDKLEYVFEHDFGFQEQAAASGRDAFWYGINQYLTYDFTDTLSAGLRAEWFRDANGTRVTAGNPADYFALTTGVNWKPQSWLTLRPEVRYDRADAKINPYANQSRDHQLQFAMDVVIDF